MPYASKKQAAFIHAEAARGTGWAKKFVKDAHGTHVQGMHKVHQRTRLASRKKGT